MDYEIRFKASALKAFRKLHGEKRGRVAEAILRLAEEPRPTGSRKISGRRGLYRIRIGDYRVIYEVQHEVLVVLIIKVAHRREAYRKL